MTETAPTSHEKGRQKAFVGRVVSNKMQKTVVVAVETGLTVLPSLMVQVSVRGVAVGSSLAEENAIVRNANCSVARVALGASIEVVKVCVAAS